MAMGAGAEIVCAACGGAITLVQYAAYLTSATSARKRGWWREGIIRFRLLW